MKESNAVGLCLIVTHMIIRCKIEVLVILSFCDWLIEQVEVVFLVQSTSRKKERITRMSLVQLKS
jgi:hypothetical protein